MNKSQEVAAAVGELYRENRNLQFTAGRVAKMARVSVNTAKKWLCEMAGADDTPLRWKSAQYRKGVIMTVFFFALYPEE